MAQFSPQSSFCWCTDSNLPNLWWFKPVVVMKPNPCSFWVDLIDGKPTLLFDKFGGP